MYWLMEWKKFGRIFSPDCYGEKYGANPVAVQFDDNIYRIFFNTRDEKNISKIVYMDFDIKRVQFIDSKPTVVVERGEMGAFDDSGCSLGCVVDSADCLYIYYLGWNLMRTAPWMNEIGLAIYDKQSGQCSKYSPAPIIGRSTVDPFSLSYPYVMKFNGDYFMWYGSNLSWGNTCLKSYDFKHVIKYATSKDGINWERKGIVCLQGDNENEYAFARPSVIYENGLYKMWYTYRGEKYRIGYAESGDGIAWQRKDLQTGIDISDDSWEAEEVCYPMVFLHDENYYMLYCGNGYGKTGFGLARLIGNEF